MCKIANRIKNCRIQKKLTQEDLAGKLGLKKSAIAKYENGRVENIKRTTIEEMARIFGCKPSYLMGWDDEPSTIAAHLDGKDFTEEQWSRIESFAKFIKNEDDM